MEKKISIYEYFCNEPKEVYAPMNHATIGASEWRIWDSSAKFLHISLELNVYVAKTGHECIA